MRQLKKVFSIILVSSLVGNSALAACEQDLERCAREGQTVIRMADEVIRGQQTEIGKLMEINEQHQAIEQNLQQKIADQDAEASAWYRNPVLMPVLGFIAGSLAVQIIVNSRR